MSVKRVLVTGGSGALGTHVVHRFAADGAEVHATEPPRAINNEFKALPASDPVRRHAVDLANEPSVVALFESIERDAGAIDAVVHVVGGFAAGRLDATSLALLDAQMSINLRTAFLVTRESLRHMRPRQRGRIVVVASRAAEQPRGGAAAYAISKAAVVALVRTAAVELRGTSVTINAISPDTIDTPANRATMPDADFSKWVSPDAIARTAAFLCTDAGGAISGANVGLSF